MIPNGFGVGIPWQRAADDPLWYSRVLKKLQPTCWYNWLNDQTHHANYTPMLWRCNAVNVANTLFTAQAVGEQLWFIGNEPEQTSQSNTTPQDFVDGVIAWQESVGGQIALPGLYWDTYEHGKAWLDEYVRLGGPIPDYWAVHMYQPAGHQWRAGFPGMIEHLRGIADIPILLTECGGSYNDEACILEVMHEVWLAVERGDVQAAWWFSAYYEADMPHNNLLTDDGKLTPIGEAYRRMHSTVFMPQVSKTC